MLRVLVTGGSGFIGTNLVEHHVSRGDMVLNLDIVAPRNSAHRSFWKFGDLLDRTGLHSIVNDFAPEVVFHMGARTDLGGHFVTDYPANTIGVENLINAVEGVTALRHLIFASSRLVCRIGYTPKDELDYCPTTPYGESKVIGERLVHHAIPRLPCTTLIVRPTSIWGPWFDVPYKTFFLSIANGRYVHPGRVKILKSFGFVGNTIHELERLVIAPVNDVAGKTFYLGDFPPIDVAIMANAIQHELGSKPIRAVPIGVLRSAAWFGDCLKIMGWRNTPLTLFRLNNLLTPMVHDLEQLQSVVGALPHSMEQGVRITVDWLRTVGEVS